MNSQRKLKIISSGSYLPQKIRTSLEIDSFLKLKPGSAESMSGVRERRVADSVETTSKMGSLALEDALTRAGLKIEDIDAVICASGSAEQEIPCTAALLLRHFNKPNLPVAGFDLNATCLSFVTALDCAASLIETNRYKRIAIVSSEISSVGLNPKQHEAYALFGDGAAAIIIERTPEGESSRVLSAHMKTYPAGSEFCKIVGGGSKLHPSKFSTEELIDTLPQFLFHMDGRKVFKLVLETIPEFFEWALRETKLNLDEINLFIPHQASASGMELVRRKLKIDKTKYMDILSDHGNMIAASIPLALHYAITQQKIKRGDKVFLLGTSAGMSIGSVCFEY